MKLGWNDAQVKEAASESLTGSQNWGAQRRRSQDAQSL